MNQRMVDPRRVAQASIWIVAAAGFVALRLWILADVAPDWHSDSETYWKQTSRGLDGALFGRERPFGYPLFLWLLEFDRARVVLAQRLIGAGCWLILALAARRLFRTGPGRISAFVLIASVGLTQDVVQWDAMVITESLMLSLWVLMIAFASAHWTGGSSLWALAAFFVITLIFNGLRDANLYPGAMAIGLAAMAEMALATRMAWSRRVEGNDCAIGSQGARDGRKSGKNVESVGDKFADIGNTPVPVGARAPRNGVRRAVAGLILVAAGMAGLIAQNMEMRAAKRYLSNLHNVLCRKALITVTGPTSAQLSPNFAYFVERYGLPESAMERAGKIASSPGEWPEFRAWILEDGMAAYRDFLLRNPGFAHAALAEEWPPNQRDLYIWDLAERTSREEAPKLKEGYLRANWGASRLLSRIWERGLGWALGWRGLNDALLGLGGLLGLGFVWGMAKRSRPRATRSEHSSPGLPLRHEECGPEGGGGPCWIGLAGVGAILAAGTWINRFLAILGDAIETWRHSLLGLVSVYLLAGLAMAGVVEAAVLWSRKRGNDCGTTTPARPAGSMAKERRTAAARRKLRPKPNLRRVSGGR